MRRLTLILTALLAVAIALVADSASFKLHPSGSGLALGGLTQDVTLGCSDGIETTETTLVVGAATLTALASAVEAMTLFPAGLVCHLTEAPLLSASGAGGLLAPRIASAETPPKDFVVGGGRFLSCLNFSVSAHSDNLNSPASTKGSVTETLPQPSPCGSPRGHYKAKVVCLSVSGSVARLNANYVENSGFFAPFGHVQAAFLDNGNPGPLGPVDFVGFSNMPGTAPVAAGCNTVTPANPFSNGNVSVHDAP